MKYAIIRVQGKQYKVSQGEEFLVDKIKGEPRVEVMLVVDDDKVTIGKPILEKTEVKVKVTNETEKGEKIKVSKYKAKSRYRKNIGFRPVYTKLRVEKIS